MSEATISFSNHDQIRTLFGARDQFLRKVRERVGVDVVVRGDELHLHGSDDQIHRGLQIFTELRTIVEETGKLQEADVLHVLDNGNGASKSDETPIEDDDSSSDARLSHEVNVRPRTPGQVDYVDAIDQNELIFCIGPAGCGKTYLAVAMALNALRREQVRKIVLVRPAVEAGEKLGFLPGDLLAKVNPYLRPLLDALNDILDSEAVKRYLENDVIEVVPLAFMRGRTLNNTFIILDEGQNTTITQMKMFLTRMGTGSQIVVTGDITQTDLPPHMSSGLVDAMKRLAQIDSVAIVQLSGRDIVRHRLVKEIVRAYDQETRSTKSRKK